MVIGRRHISCCVALCCAGVVGLAACEHAEPLPTAPAAPTLSSLQTTIFNVSCAVSGCHLGDGAPRGLDLAAGASWANLVDVQSSGVPSLKLVVRGDPDNSYLVMKLEGAPGIVGQRMPQGRDPLTPAQITAIREWIAAGAADD